MRLKILICILLTIAFNVFSQQDSTRLKTMLDVAYGLEQTNPSGALLTYDSVINISGNNKLIVFAAKANNYKGIVYSDMGKYDSAVYYYQESIKVFQRMNDLKGVAANKINIGNTYQYRADYSKATSYYIEGIKLYEQLDDQLNLAISNGNLGTIFESIGQPIDALFHYYKSNKSAKMISDSIQLIHNHCNLSKLFLSRKQNDSALFHIENASKYISNSSHPEMKYLYSYRKADYFSQVNNFKKSLKEAQFALKQLNLFANPYYQTQTYSLIAHNYNKLNQIDLALENAIKAKDIALKYHSKEGIMNAYQLLSGIYNKTANYKQALLNTQMSHMYKDSILNESKTNSINLINAKFNTEKKDKEILQQQLEIEQNNNQLKKRNIQFSYLIGLVGLLLLSVILLWFLNQQRQKRKDQELLALQRKNKIQTLESLRLGEEKERYRIAQELHDGVNGDLSAIKHKLNTLDSSNEEKTFSDVIDMIDKSCDQVRAISHNLVPPALDTFDLKTAASDYCAQMNDIHPSKISFQYLGDSVTLPKKIEVNIFRIIQELVTNSIKHANAKEVNVQLSAVNGHIQLTVEDNGCGYDTSQKHNDGIGLTNIRHRVDYLNGELDITSSDKGTYVNILLDKKELYEN